ncbi:MAG: response regulators consisting of a CheY-like receiver domain and a winged-helix DNA-binding [bacterium]|nr:MAG: response regulators consisting of a CheY-like receiver domain and a winged-helix DNA-binding [bacterium]
MITANKECPVCQNHHDASLSICSQNKLNIESIPTNSAQLTDQIPLENLTTLKHTLKIAALNNDIKTLCQSYIKIAQYFRSIEDLDQALSYLYKAELLQPNNTTNNLKEIISIYCKQSRLDRTLRPIQQLAKSYAQTGQIQQAKTYFEQLISTCPPDLNWLHEVLLILDNCKLTTALNLSSATQKYIEKAHLTYQVDLLVSVAMDDSDESMPLINDLIEEETPTFDSSQLKIPIPSNGLNLGFSPVADLPLINKLPPVFDANNQLNNTENRFITPNEPPRLVFPVDSPIPSFDAKFLTKEIPVLAPASSTKQTIDPLPKPNIGLSEISEPRSYGETRPSFSIRNTGSFRPIERQTFSDLSVMVVDDDAAVRELIVELLTEFSCHVIEAIDGEEAIEKLKDISPSFIISDINMPRKNGYELFEYLQSNDNFADIPFVFLTGCIEADNKLQALQGGVEDYWLKPFEIGEISIRLRRMLQKVRLAGDVRGKLSEMPLPDLLQSLASGNKSGILHLSRSGRYGVIYIDQGRIIDAEFEDLAGKTAIYCLVNWCMDGGNFNFHSQTVDRTMVIKQSIQGILMEAMRRRDEEVRLIDQLPPGEVFMSVNTEDNPEFFSADFSDETMRILQLFDGTHSLSECLNCLQGDLETIQTVVALNKAGLLRIVDFGLE